MTVRIEQQFTQGGVTIAAVVRQDVTARSGWLASVLSARKDPIAILIHDGTNLRALSPDGTPMPMEALERICPQVAAFPASAPD